MTERKNRDGERDWGPPHVNLKLDWGRAEEGELGIREPAGEQIDCDRSERGTLGEKSSVWDGKHKKESRGHVESSLNTTTGRTIDCGLQFRGGRKGG